MPQAFCRDIILGMIIAISTTLLLLWLAWQHRRRRNLPPGPFPLPVVGNLLELTKSKLPHQQLARMAREKFGPIMYLELGCVPTVVVSDGEVARDFLVKNDRVFASRPRMTAIELMDYGHASSFGMGAYGPRWQRTRKFLSLHLFGPKCIASQKHARRDELLLLLHDLRARTNADVNITVALARMVENVVCRTLMRCRMAALVDSLRHKVGNINFQELGLDAGALFQVPIFGDFIPFLAFLDRATKRLMAETGAKIDLAWESLIKEREKERQRPAQDKTNLSGGEDLLDELLRNYSCDREAIKACLSSVLLGALETTTASLDWTMAELLSNPTIFKKLQTEIQSVVGPHRLVEEEDLVQLPYVKAVVKESLRLHPPLALAFPHMAMDACRVMGGQYKLHKGTSVLINIWAIGRDPKLWPDAEKFLPERFMGAPDALRIDVHGQHFDTIPFGSGRRSCPGMPMALPLLQVVVATMAHCFDWQVSGTINLSEKQCTVVTRGEPLTATPIWRLNVPYA